MLRNLEEIQMRYRHLGTTYSSGYFLESPSKVTYQVRRDKPWIRILFRTLRHGRSLDHIELGLRRDLLQFIFCTLHLYSLE